MLHATAPFKPRPPQVTTGLRSQRPCPSDYYFSRDLSWLEANARLLVEAGDASTPVSERVKSLAFFSG